MSKLTKEQEHVLKHSLGLNRSSESYRNRFVTGRGSVDYPVCMSLVEAGLMSRRDGGGLPFGGDDLFHVTDLGRQTLGGVE